MFQFQTGAIKSLYDVENAIEWDHCFNSKLVRLKEFAIGIDTECNELCFNSKLVRLKEVTVSVYKLRRFVLFQFQTGAIKRLACSVF